MARQTEILERSGEKKVSEKTDVRRCLVEEVCEREIMGMSLREVCHIWD
jgi:hypothetical protein